MTTRTTLRLTMSSRPDGADVATCGRHSATSRSGAQMKLARVLVAAGYPDMPWQTRRGRDVCMTGPSLHGLAGLTVANSRIVRFGGVEREMAE